jgi:AraC-like DNA-binding protein
MNTILLLGCLQALFLFVLLLSKRTKSLADKVLAVWLLHIGIHLLIYYLYGQSYLSQALVINLNTVLPFMQGPYIYIYTRALVDRSFAFTWKHTFHLLPALGFLVYVFFIYPQIAHQTALRVSLFGISAIFTLFILLSVPVYIYLSFRELTHFKQLLHNNLSSTEGVDGQWLRYILIGMSLFWLVIILLVVNKFLGGSDPQHSGAHGIFLPLTLFIYAIGYLGIKQKPIFVDLVNPAADNQQKEDRPKYEKSSLSQSEAQAIAQRLKNWMETEQAYLDENLTLAAVCDALALPGHTLSQVLNQEFQKNFYEFVNRYRVDEFIALRSDPNNQNYTILALALDSGFASKASFNRAFKKLTGLAPSQYPYEQN